MLEWLQRIAAVSNTLPNTFRHMWPLAHAVLTSHAVWLRPCLSCALKLTFKLCRTGDPVGRAALAGTWQHPGAGHARPCLPRSSVHRCVSKISTLSTSFHCDTCTPNARIYLSTQPYQHSHTQCFLHWIIVFHNSAARWSQSLHRNFGARQGWCVPS